MGCCSSKSRTERHTLDTLDNNISSAAALAEKLQCEADAGVDAANALDNAPLGVSASSTNLQESALALLMDTVEGSLLLKSDGDPTPSSPPPTTALRVTNAIEQIEFSGVAGYDDCSSTKPADANNDATVIRAAELTSGYPHSPSPPQSPARSLMQTSPRKVAVNYEDVPINSMYHRIHTIEAEALAERRRQELHEETERREREMIEFKAAMLRS